MIEAAINALDLIAGPDEAATAELLWADCRQSGSNRVGPDKPGNRKSEVLEGQYLLRECERR